jgi:solute carrier family 35, member E1
MWLTTSQWLVCRWVAAQSVFYHLYNQVSYMSLHEISPLTFSVGNTIKRISVIVASIIIFQTPVQPINALGAAIAILGTFIYSQVISLQVSFEFIMHAKYHLPTEF